MRSSFPYSFNKQFLKMNSQSLTKFAVVRNHVTTSLSQVEILLFFARDLCSTAQHLVCIHESSIQRSDQPVFIVSFNLPSFLPSGLKFTGNVFTAAPVSRFIFTHSNLLGLLVTLTSKPPSEKELAGVSYVFVPSNRTPVILPLIKTPASVPFVRTPLVMNTRRVSGHVPFVLIPEFPDFSLFSSFQDLRDQFSMFCLCIIL